jgi:hypothetical protein
LPRAGANDHGRRAIVEALVGEVVDRIVGAEAATVELGMLEELDFLRGRERRPIPRARQARTSVVSIHDDSSGVLVRMTRYINARSPEAVEGEYSIVA